MRNISHKSVQCEIKPPPPPPQKKNHTHRHTPLRPLLALPSHHGLQSYQSFYSNAGFTAAAT